LSTFSDVPPLLVDGRPTALKATQPLVCTLPTKTEFLTDAVALAALSPQGPKGPPPKPPPRPVNKGHGRSASLDLNTFINSTAPGPKHNTAAEVLQRGATLPAQASLRYHPCNSMPADTACFSTAEWQDSNSSPRHLAPPLPPRATFVDVCVQTESSAASSRSFTDGRELIELNIDMEKRIEELLAAEGNSDAGVGCSCSGGGGTASTAHMNWRDRCDHLRKLNAHLEAERTKLAQIRLQLELRLEEAAGNQPSMKPTSL
uniref:DUF3736 domain-containing protein n=1 Tax=Gongylonema pulchrum TaxID=637853 RepID=A0A183EHE6_9BILA